MTTEPQALFFVGFNPHRLNQVLNPHQVSQILITSMENNPYPSSSQENSFLLTPNEIPYGVLLGRAGKLLEVSTAAAGAGNKFYIFIFLTEYNVCHTINTQMGTLLDRDHLLFFPTPLKYQMVPGTFSRGAQCPERLEKVDLFLPTGL